MTEQDAQWILPWARIAPFPSPHPQIVERAKFISFLQQRRQADPFAIFLRPSLQEVTHPHTLQAAGCAEAFPALQSHRPEDAAPPSLSPPLCSRLEPPFLPCFPGLREPFQGASRASPHQQRWAAPLFAFFFHLPCSYLLTCWRLRPGFLSVSALAVKSRKEVG